MGNSISIGSAYKDQDLDGSTITNSSVAGATNAQIAVLAAVTAGTGAASKALVLDSSANLTFPNTGTFTYGISATAVEAAEHGAGAVGTSSFGAPQTYRWIDKGVITTQIKFDLTGLASVADADDVIGLAAGGAAYIGRNVVDRNGVIFRAELSCIETPVTGGGDVDVRTSSSASAAYDSDGAGYTSLINGGTLVIGQTLVNDVPAVVANDYLYLTVGTSAAGTYSAGMFILTLYGHAPLA